MKNSKNYRIKHIIIGDDTYYYPQERFLGFFWLNVSGVFGTYFNDFDCCERFLKSHIKSKQKPSVYYDYYD